MTYQRLLFIFRRDLRLEDNTGLIFALKSAKEVIPAFIFTPQQITDNRYRSDHCLQFMIESLEDLDLDLKKKGSQLYLFFDQPENVIGQCVETLKIDGVVANRDYTPFSVSRDKKIASICKQYKIGFHTFDDVLLHPPEQILKADGKPYTIFTPFYRKAASLPVSRPIHNPYTHYYSQAVSFSKNTSLYQEILPGRKALLKGGRNAAEKLLKNVPELQDYKTLKDFPGERGTTHLSAHLKFTTYSPREIYQLFLQHFGLDHPLIRSLYWRDFFTMIGFYFPAVFGNAFHRPFDKLPWHQDLPEFKKWCEGQTGFPLVDAGMREMRATGYMHNRVRMIVASFLVKDLHIDWRWGEKYFAQTLIDYDPAVNNGNWQWAASTGCDAQPYFRIFNPWLQQKKFDPDCKYIKQWIPELASIDIDTIHTWYKEKDYLPISYPRPMVDHGKEAKIALRAYKAI